MTDTRQRLIAATIATLRDKGMAGTSARVIAAAAGANQALIFYHFGTVDELIAVACREGAAERVAAYRDQFADVRSLRELLAVGRRINDVEREVGNVAVLAQVLAGGQQHPGLAAAARHALDLWITEIETALARLLRSSPLADVVDVPGLARGIAASFVGIELYDGVDPAGAERALGALETLGVLVEVVDDLGPVARRALRARLRKTGQLPESRQKARHAGGAT
jgi:AcrR family transcriptional regulator